MYVTLQTLKLNVFYKFCQTIFKKKNRPVISNLYKKGLYEWYCKAVSFVVGSISRYRKRLSRLFNMI